MATDWSIEVSVNGISIEQLGGRYCNGRCVFRVRWEGGVG